MRIEIASFCLVYFSFSNLNVLQVQAIANRADRKCQGMSRGVLNIRPTISRIINDIVPIKFLIRIGSRNTITYAIESVSDAIRSIPRGVKALASSDLESLLLKCTMPSNKFINEEYVSVLLSNFEKFDEISDTYCVDAYEILAHKLTTKMREDDWRTVAKATYLVHRLIREISPSKRKLFCQHLLVPIEDTRILLRQRLRKEAPTALAVTRGSWEWVLAYLDHLEAECNLGSRDAQHLQDLTDFQGPAPLLRLVTNYLSTATVLLQTSRSLLTSSSSNAQTQRLDDVTNLFPHQSFISEFAKHCDSLTTADIADMLTCLSSMRAPIDGGYSRIEQGAVDEIQQLATETLRSVGSLRSIVRKRISDGLEYKDSSSSCLPSLPGWVHDLSSMQALLAEGPLRTDCHGKVQYAHLYSNSASEEAQS